MRRGELYIGAAKGAYTGKPRPVLIVQDDRFDCTSSMTVCPLTSQLIDASLVRLEIAPSPINGLRVASQVMVDKVVTVPRSALGERVGKLSAADLGRVNISLLVFLGLAD
ncbi:MAG: type II toxin-antitoxin system PemK/MazF family toxin [Angustibacter sp.]